MASNGPESSCPPADRDLVERQYGDYLFLNNQLSDLRLFLKTSTASSETRRYLEQLQAPKGRGLSLSPPSS
jgi:hypothetical protein